MFEFVKNLVYSHNSKELISSAIRFNTAWRKPKFLKLLGTLVIGGFVLQQISDISGLSESLEIEGYVDNAIISEAQIQVKKTVAQGGRAISRFDELMVNAPTLKPTTGYRIVTPQGHYAFYHENEQGEPFLLDDYGNLWVWAGADANNPVDDWLVRTTQGEIYNYFINDEGNLQQRLLGNENDLKLIPDSNLGTIIGFANENLDDLHYKELPTASLENFRSPRSEQKKLVPPPILEEGFMEFRRKENSSVSSLVGFDEIDNSIRRNGEQFKIASDVFLNSIEVVEEDVIQAMENSGHINTTEAQQLKSELADLIQKETDSTIEGLGVSDLPSALKFFDLTLTDN